MNVVSNVVVSNEQVSNEWSRMYGLKWIGLNSHGTWWTLCFSFLDWSF